MSAVAAVAGVLVALITHIPDSASTPNSVPNPNYIGESPTNGAPPQPVSLGPTQPAGPPAGCQLGDAAIKRFNNMVGSTPYSEEQAASRAEQDTYEAAIGGNSSGTIQKDLESLSQDFAQLTGAAEGLMGGHQAPTPATMRRIPRPRKTLQRSTMTARPAVDGRHDKGLITP